MTKERKKIFSDGREVKIHSESDFMSMEKAGALAAEVLDFITPHVQQGITTDA